MLTIMKTSRVHCGNQWFTRNMASIYHYGLQTSLFKPPFCIMAWNLQALRKYKICAIIKIHNGYSTRYIVHYFNWITQKENKIVNKWCKYRRNVGLFVERSGTQSSLWGNSNNRRRILVDKSTGRRRCGITTEFSEVQIWRPTGYRLHRLKLIERQKAHHY